MEVDIKSVIKVQNNLKALKGDNYIHIILLMFLAQLKNISPISKFQAISQALQSEINFISL